LFAAKITAKRGEEWLKNLEEVRRERMGIKFTKEWAEAHLDELATLLQTLKGLS
jgi:hypothetical protein